jgi:predicted metal-binding membrane protein
MLFEITAVTMSILIFWIEMLVHTNVPSSTPMMAAICSMRRYNPEDEHRYFPYLVLHFVLNAT